MHRYNVKVGDEVCDENYRHQRVISIDGEIAILEDGIPHHIIHDLDNADHTYRHPTDEERLQFRLDNPYTAQVEW